MRIGEFEDAVGKQVLARREASSGDPGRIGARLADPGHGAIAPAAGLPDAVVLSAEARAAHLPPNLASLPLPPFPSPLQLIAALKEFASAETAPAREQATARLAQLIVRLARSLPPAAGVPPGQNPVAARLVRSLLGPDPAGVAALVRQLLAASAATDHSPATVPATSYERAAVAILTAVLQLRSEVPLPAGSASPGNLPPALMGFLVPPNATRARRRPRRQPGRGEADPGTEDEEDYRLDSRRR